MADILILGGYGNFGRRIATLLVNAGTPVIIAGRNAEKAASLAKTLGPLATYASFDVRKQLNEKLTDLNPRVVINTCGPFQSATYTIAETCIARGMHYIDLADARSYVRAFSTLQMAASEAGVIAITAASSVPCLSSAVLDHFRTEFSRLDSVKYGISPGQRADIGEATAAAILSYTGKPLEPFPGSARAFGWQDLYRQDYPLIGKRWMANCEIPDLDIFPEHYGLKEIRFSAGIEMGAIHIGLWILSWAVRSGLPIDLTSLVKPMLWMARKIGRFGSDRSGMHIIMRGLGTDSKPLEKRWFLISEGGCGPFVAAVPAAIMAKRLVSTNHNLKPGAFNSTGLITLADYLEALRNYPIQTFSETAS